MTILRFKNQPIEAFEKRDIDITTGAPLIASSLVRDIQFGNIEYGILNKFTLYPLTRTPYKFSKAVGVPDGQVIIGNSTPTDFTPNTNLKTANFDPKWVAVQYTMTQQLANDLGADLITYVENNIKQLLIQKIEKQAIGEGTAAGSEQNAFQAMTLAPNVEVVPVTFTGADTTLGMLDQDAAINLNRAILTPVFTSADNFWIFGSNVQDVVDAYGNSMFTYDNGVPDHAVGRLLSKPVFSGGSVLAGTNGGYANICGILMNKFGYGVALSDIEIKRIDFDTLNVSQGSITFVGSCFADGKVLDANAVKLAGFNTVTAPA